MTDAQKLAILKKRTNETDEELLSSYLDYAAQRIIEKAYPFKHNATKVPPRYSWNQIEIAEFMYYKRGAEGETFHSENGIQRTYERSSVPPEMLKPIVPFSSGFFSSEEEEEDENT